MRGLLAVGMLAVVAVSCVYNPRPLRPQADENEPGCALLAKGEYEKCWAAGKSRRVCDSSYDAIYTGCLAYGGGLDAGEPVKPIELPGVR